MLNAKIVLDLGSARARAALIGKSVIIDEACLVAVREEDDKIVALGNAALNLRGHSSGINIIPPFEHGTICNLTLATHLISYLIGKIIGSKRIFKPDLMLVCPAIASEVERHALLDAALSAGARSAVLIDAPLSSAIGAKIAFILPAANFIFHLGAGCSEAAIISSGAIINFSSVKIGGNQLDQQIISYIKKKANLTIGINSAENLKLNLTPQIEINGQDIITGLPKTISMTSEEILPVFHKFFQTITPCVKNVFENANPDLISDIINKGIVLTGGLAKLQILNSFFMQSTGLPCHLAPSSDLCPLFGALHAYANLENYEKFIRKT